MDNAENNVTAMQELANLLKKQGITFDPKDNRIRCYPHIINICVSHIVTSLMKIDTSDFDDVEEENSNMAGQDEVQEEEEDGGYMGAEDGEVDHIRSAEYLHNEDWFEKVKRDPVKRARTLVRTIRSSGQRRDKLMHTIKIGNETQSFKDEKEQPITIREVQLIRDVKHCWDSLFSMISRLIELRQVGLLYCNTSDHSFSSKPLDSLCYDKKLIALALQEGDWDVLDGLYVVLNVRVTLHRLNSIHNMDF